MNDEWITDDKTEYIHEFTLDKIQKSEVLHVVGKPSSGKTFLILFILYALKHLYAVCQVFCGTEDTQNAFTPVVGGAFVSSTYDEHQHRKQIARQSICKKECAQGSMIEVIDDFGYNTKISKSETIIQSHKNGSQWFDQLLIMGYQSIRDIPEKILNSPSKVFIFMETEDSNRRKIHRAYFKVLIPEYKDFAQLMNDICQDFTCLVVDLKSQTSKLEDSLFYYKAPGWAWKTDPKPKEGKKVKLHPYPEGWTFGCSQFRQWSEQRYDPNAIPDFITDLHTF